MNIEEEEEKLGIFIKETMDKFHREQARDKRKYCQEKLGRYCINCPDKFCEEREVG